ncbi:MAG TPA: hypothetical protein VIU40_05850, partial [Geobacteraceae bacterium]
MSKYLVFWVGMVPLVLYIVRYEKEIQKDWGYFFVAAAYLVALVAFTRFMRSGSRIAPSSRLYSV